ncbi:hypothetical protein EFV57_14550 [Yersinia enterocolitica]|nr:hypothetical protein [Yersinia enterocolitica]
MAGGYIVDNSIFAIICRHIVTSRLTSVYIPVFLLPVRLILSGRNTYTLHTSSGMCVGCSRAPESLT